MLASIEKAFRDLMSSLQIARLYPNWHPEFKKSIDKAYVSLQEALKEKQSLVVGFVGEEIAFEKEILFDLSKIEKPSVLYLKDRGIERIEFLQGLDSEELSKFIAFLITPKEEIKNVAEQSLSVLGITNIIIGKIKAPSESSSGCADIPGAVSYLNLFEDSLGSLTGYLDAVMNGEKLDSFALKLNISQVMGNLLGRYQEFLNLGVMKRYDNRTYFHVMNVSILSMYFSSKLGFEREDVLHIGIAALFHDIGKLYISRKIIQKPARLTEEEFNSIKNHVIKGSEILLKYIDALGILPIVICFEHHLKYDLSGYPKLAFKQSQHIASQIVSICDVYDALSQRRGYKNDYPPNMIYNIMTQEKGKTFEPGLLERFFKIVGVWPVGAIVELNDSRVAVVREENEDEIFLPKVEVIFPREEKENIDLKTQADKYRIERFLNPLTDGKEYLPLI